MVVSPALAPPPGNPRFALFDSLRGLAALAILAFHVASFTGALANGLAGDALAVLGPRSLTLFFVISGFLLYRPYVSARVRGRSSPPLGRYLRRRALRILPAYWVALTLLAVFPGIVGVLTDDWWRYYGFLQLYSSTTVGGGIAVAWSLCVEVTFYLLLPFWAWLIRRITVGRSEAAGVRIEAAALAVLVACGVGVQLASARGEVSDLVASSLLGQCAWLGLGMMLAVASVATDRRPLKLAGWVRVHPGLCWLGAAAALGGLVALLDPSGLTGIIQSLNTRQPVPESLAVLFLTGALVVLLVLPAVFGEEAGGGPRRLLAWRPVAWLGLVSYGLFLWHLPVAEYLIVPAGSSRLSADGPGLSAELPFAVTPILLLLTLAVSAALAAASYYLVELPFLRRKER